MKKYSFIIILLIIVGFSSCIQDYLDDGGLSKAEVNMTPYDYLANHTYHMFDSIIEIIDYYGLKDEMNGASTVIIPTDFSVRTLLSKKTKELYQETGDEGRIYNMDSLYKNFTADSIRIYFFHDKIDLESAPQNPTEFTTYAGDGTGYAVYKRESTNSDDWKVPGTDNTYLTTRPYYLYMRKIMGDYIDEIDKEFDDTAEQLREQDISVRCQTTGIICTPTGTVLHVLENSHILSVFRILGVD